jgi:hypothetical protein
MDEYETLSLFSEDSAESHREPPPTATGRRLAVLISGLALLTAATVVSWTDGSSTSTRPAAAQGAVDPRPAAALLPGGSVYQEQVPHVLRPRCTD